MAEEFISSFDGTKLFVNIETSEADRAVIVMVHGLAEHQGRYDYVAEKFHEEGIGTYRFDHRGHGRSEGECAYLSDYNELLDDTNVLVDRAIAENPDKPVFLLGHSMGGLTVTAFCAKYPKKRLAGVITSGALVCMEGSLFALLPEMDPHTQLPNELGDGVCSVQEVRDWYVQDPLNRKSYAAGLVYACNEGLKWLEGTTSNIAYPILITHGEKDGLVGVHNAPWLFDHVSSADKQMKIYGNLFHEIMNEYCRDEVIGDYVHWMEMRI
ncbi:MAG: alpha/beta hydrolase [Coriobacteriales bacterium]|nr:alpha/beta hydrolase [Coriobacteriales bacterium]